MILHSFFSSLFATNNTLLFTPPAVTPSFELYCFLSFGFQIDKQFGYFPKDAVKEEQVYATIEKVVETQVNDFDFLFDSTSIFFRCSLWRKKTYFIIINI